MKTIFLFILMLPVFCLQAEESRKSFHKTFPVEGIEEIVVKSCLGKVEICQKEDVRNIEMEVEVKVEARSLVKAEETLRMITVLDSRQDEALKFETCLDRAVAFKHFITNMEVDIDYRITVPKGLKLRLVMSNGKVDLGDFEGEINADIRTGDIEAGTVRGGEFCLLQEKGSFEADEVERLSAEFLDCEVEIENLGEMRGRLSACSGKFGSVGRMDVRSSGGKVKIGDVERLICGSQYTDFVLEDLGGVLDMDMDWGSLNVGNVQAMFAEIRVRGSHARMGFTFADETSYNLSVRHNRPAKIELPEGMPVEVHPSDRKNVIEFSSCKGEGRSAGKVRLELTNGSLYIQ